MCPKPDGKYQALCCNEYQPALPPFIVALSSIISLILKTKHSKGKYDTGKKHISHLLDPGATLDIESLSISLNVRSLLLSSDFPVQFTGTNTAKASAVIGTNIFKLHNITITRSSKHYKNLTNIMNIEKLSLMRSIEGRM